MVKLKDYIIKVGIPSVVAVTAITLASTSYNPNEAELEPTQASVIGTPLLSTTQSEQIELEPLSGEAIWMREQKFVEVDRLDNYLKSVGSPMNASYIFEVAEKHAVDPYIITAISCVESSCFKNCWNGNCQGWAITDSGNYSAIHSDIYAGLEHFAREYSVSRYAGLTTAEEISQAGYNTRQSWINSMNYFLNIF